MTKAFGTEGQGGTAVLTRKSAKTMRRSSRRRGGFVRFLALIAALFLVLYGVGFFIFLNDIALYRAPEDRRADGIVVLTGGRDRIDEAVRLFEAGMGARLLISGVHASTTHATLMHTYANDEALFSCCVDLDHNALDTIGNAEEAAAWADRHGYRSLIVVTNDYHMPRSLLEMERVMQDVSLVPHAVVSAGSGEGSLREELSRYRVLLGEYVKYGAARLRTLFPAPAGG